MHPGRHASEPAHTFYETEHCLRLNIKMEARLSYKSINEVHVASAFRHGVIRVLILIVGDVKGPVQDAWT